MQMKVIKSLQSITTTITVKVRFIWSTLGDFTFWNSLSLSLFAQSEIRTERKLKQKVKSIFLFGLSPNFGLSEKTELIVWSEVRTEPEVNLNYPDSVQMNLHARDRLIPYRLTFAERKTTSLF